MTDLAKLIISATDPPVDIGAQFLACLAYPVDAAKRAKFFGALIYYGYSKLPASIGYGMAIRGLTHLIKTECNASVQDVLNRGIGVITSKRLIAAKMAHPTFVAALMEERFSVPLPGPVPSFGSEAMMEAIARDLLEPGRKSNRGPKPASTDSRNDANVLNRQWKESRPSLALGLTVHELCFRSGVDGFDIDSLFADRELARRLCKYAASINGLVVKKFKLEQYVQIIINP